MCDCRVCTDYKSFQELLSHIPEPQRESVEKLYEVMAELEMDRDYYKAIVQNKWPSGDIVLAHYRKLPKELNEPTTSAETTGS